MAPERCGPIQKMAFYSASSSTALIAANVKLRRLLVIQSPPETDISGGPFGLHKGGYVRHPYASYRLLVSGRGQFLFFFLRQNPKHFDAHFALMR